MDVLVINASYSLDKGATHTLLGKPFFEGLKSAGANIDIMYLKALRIKPCSGCMMCTIKHPGLCIYNDDFEIIKKSVENKQLLIFLAPIYTISNILLCNFISRLYSLKTTNIFNNNHFGYGCSIDTFPNKLILISTCAFYELDNFNPLIEISKNLSYYANIEFIGSILRPHVHCLLGSEKDKNHVFYNEMQELCFKLGQELVEKERFNHILLNKIQEPIVNVEEYVAIANYRIKNYFKNS